MLRRQIIPKSLHITYFKPLVRFFSTPQLTSPTSQSNDLFVKAITPNDTYVSCTIFDKQGNVEAVSKKFPKWQFLQQHGLYPRDLRKIDTSVVDIVPSVVIKENCILVNLLHIKALVEQDKVMVFDTSDPTAAPKLGLFMYDLEAKLKAHSAGWTQQYEHKALESILINVMSSLENEFNEQKYTCSLILSELEDQIDRDKLRELLIRSKTLSAFYQRAVLVRDVLDTLLDNDEDLAGMYLTEKRAESDDYGEVEMLLEAYYKQCDEFVQQSESLIADIKSTEEIVNIILDANRNSLMLFELKVTIYTLGFTVATLAPAFYGMNLKNFIEESYVGFAGVLVFSVIAGFMVTVRSFKRLQAVTKIAMMTPHKTTPEPTKKRISALFRGTKDMHSTDPKQRDMIWRWLTEEENRR